MTHSSFNACILLDMVSLRAREREPMLVEAAELINHDTFKFACMAQPNPVSLLRERKRERERVWCNCVRER